MPEKATKPQTGMIVFKKSEKETLLKIFLNSERSKAENLANYLKEKKKLPPLDLIYAHAISMGIDNEKDLIVMDKTSHVFKGEGPIEEMCRHTFHKSMSNPFVIGGINDDSYIIVEYFAQD